MSNHSNKRSVPHISVLTQLQKRGLQSRRAEVVNWRAKGHEEKGTVWRQALVCVCVCFHSAFCAHALFAQNEN